jgi:hypothetical protein
MSIALFVVAVAIADAVLFGISSLLGWIYLAIVVVGLWGIITSFCTKCCCKHRCSHVVLGWIAKFLPPRKVGKYSGSDVVGVVVSFLAIALFPQAWIWAQPMAAVAFWLLAVIVIIEIARGVCPTCANTLCPFHAKPPLKRS